MTKVYTMTTWVLTAILTFSSMTMLTSCSNDDETGTVTPATNG